MTVVLAAENYPGSVEKGREIKNYQILLMILGLIMQVQRWKTEFFFQMVEESYLAQVLAIDLQEASAKAYSLIEQIELSGSHYRRDIGHRAL